MLWTDSWHIEKSDIRSRPSFRQLRTRPGLLKHNQPKEETRRRKKKGASSDKHKSSKVNYPLSPAESKMTHANVGSPLCVYCAPEG
jgi:hypothetical protein